MSTSVWTRYPRTWTAFRGADEDTLVLSRRSTGQWVLTARGRPDLMIDAPSSCTMEEVIETVDLLHPPDGWTRLDHTTWQRGEWSCVSGASGWRVRHPQYATRQVFRSADRARKWVDLRHNRPGGIKGPRLRGTSKANRTLPDVRVTEEERERFTSLAGRLNMTFSDLVRRSLTAVAEGRIELT